MGRQLFDYGYAAKTSRVDYFGSGFVPVNGPRRRSFKLTDGTVVSWLEQGDQWILPKVALDLIIEDNAKQIRAEKAAMAKYDKEREMDTVCENIRRLRQRLGMTQSELAEAAGVSRSMIASVEGGRYRTHNLDNLGSIALALGLGDVSALLAR
jgi:DNA-binding XRE family transcriptional regulator